MRYNLLYFITLGLLAFGCSKSNEPEIPLLPIDRVPFKVLEMTERLESSPPGVIQKNVFKYDGERLTGVEFWTKDGESKPWVNTLVTDYTYLNDRISQVKSYIRVDDGLLLNSTRSFVYVDNDEYADEIIYTPYDLDLGIPLSESTSRFYIYNSQKLLDNTFVDESIDHYAYNEKGGLTKIRFTSPDSEIHIDFVPTTIENPLFSLPQGSGVITILNFYRESAFLVSSSANSTPGQLPVSTVSYSFETDNENRVVKVETTFSNLDEPGGTPFVTDRITTEYQYK